MSKVVVTDFVSLDGVVEAPEKWSFPFWNDETTQFKSDELDNTGAHLLGRVTYEAFAASWPSRKGEFADRFNAVPKYVVSTRLSQPEWEGSIVIRSNVVEEIGRLRRQPGRDLMVHGSPTLVQTLMKHDLVDEYHLLVYPVVLGSGKRLFAEGTQASLKLVETKIFGAVICARYEPVRPA